MNKIKGILIIAFVAISILTDAQLYIKNSSDKPISVAVGWYSEKSNYTGYVTKGWYKVEPGETIDPGMKFTSSDDYFFYYAKGWEGEYKFLVDDNSFTIKNADKSYMKEQNPSYRWVMFQKKEVHFGMLDAKTYTLNLTSSKSQSWTGTYNYEIQGPVSYSLEIKNDNTCIYEGAGIQTYYKVSCKGKLVGNTYEIYYVKTIDGAFYPSDWLDKSKPIFKLYYNNGKLFTDEGQLNKEKKGGQILFKKSK